jgi:hypothetical protein
MSTWKLDNHIIGKAYALTQKNMNAMIADVEMLKKEVEAMDRLAISRAEQIEQLEACIEKLQSKKI